MCPLPQVRGSDDFEGLDYIVDLHFRCGQEEHSFESTCASSLVVRLLSRREQFEVSHPSADYALVLACAPEVFVGTISRLRPVVQVGT